MQPIILTSDVSAWSLRPMLYLMDKYWPGHPRFLVGGYTKPGFHFDADFYHIGRFADYPLNKWSDGLIDFLNVVQDDLVLFMLDDYWLNRSVNAAAIEAFAEYMLYNPEVARFDLSGDRLYASGWQLYDAFLDGTLPSIKSDPQSPYHFSFQAALWRRSALLKCLVPGESPWDAELSGTHRLQDTDYIVLGSTQPPMRYTIAVQQGSFVAASGGYQGSDYALPVDDLSYIIKQHWLFNEETA